MAVTTAIIILSGLVCWMSFLINHLYDRINEEARTRLEADMSLGRRIQALKERYDDDYNDLIGGEDI